MNDNERLVKIDRDRLNSVVQTALADESAQVVEWNWERVQGGTLGEVYFVRGRALRKDDQGSFPWSVVLKIQHTYIRLGDPDSWRREMLLYQQDFFQILPDSLAVPRCLGIWEESDDEIWLWLEKVTGVHGKELTWTEFALAARYLGRFQGEYLLRDDLAKVEPMLSTRHWLTIKVADWGSGAIPWLRKNRQGAGVFTLDLVEAVLQLWDKRDQFIENVDQLPRTICHRDFYSGNIFVQPGLERTTLIDWDSAGLGVIGEDLADLVAETLVFDDFELARADELSHGVLDSYLAGLREAGWQGERSLVVLGFVSCLVLQWIFRVVCRFKDSDDLVMRKRYVGVVQFILKQVGESPC